MPDPRAQRPWTPPPPSSPGSLMAILELLLGQTPPPTPPSPPKLSVPETDLTMPAPPELAALVTRQQPPPQAEAPWFATQPMTGAGFAQNVARDLPDTTQMLWQLALRPDELAATLGKGAAGAVAGGHPAFAEEQGIAGQLGEGLAATWGDPLRYAYETPAQAAIDVLDPTDLGVQGLGVAAAMALPLRAGRLEKLASKGRVRGPMDFGKPLEGLFSRSRRAAELLSEPENARRWLNSEGTIAIDQVMKALTALDASPEELAWIKFDDSLKGLREQLKAEGKVGKDARVTPQQLRELMETTTPPIEVKEKVRHPKLSKPDLKVLQQLGVKPPRTPQDADDVAAFLRSQAIGPDSDAYPDVQRILSRLDRMKLDKGTGESYRGYFPPGVHHYQITGFELPASMDTPRDLSGYRIGRKARVGYYDNPDDWVVYSPDGEQLATLPGEAADTPEAAWQAFLEKDRQESPAYQTLGPLQTPEGHSLGRNILHTRTGIGHIVEPDAPMPVDPRTLPPVAKDDPELLAYMRDQGWAGPPADWMVDRFETYYRRPNAEKRAQQLLYEGPETDVLSEAQSDWWNKARAGGFHDHPLDPIGLDVFGRSAFGDEFAEGPLSPEQAQAWLDQRRQMQATEVTDARAQGIEAPAPELQTGEWVVPTVTDPDGVAVSYEAMRPAEAAAFKAKHEADGKQVSFAPATARRPTVARRQAEGQLERLQAELQFLTASPISPSMQQRVATQARMVELREQIDAIQKGNQNTFSHGRFGSLSTPLVGGLERAGIYPEPPLAEGTAVDMALRRQFMEALREGRAGIDIPTGSFQANVYGLTARNVDRLRYDPAGKSIHRLRAETIQEAQTLADALQAKGFTALVDPTPDSYRGGYNVNIMDATVEAFDKRGNASHYSGQSVLPENLENQVGTLASQELLDPLNATRPGAVQPTGRRLDLGREVQERRDYINYGYDQAQVDEMVANLIKQRTQSLLNNEQQRLGPNYKVTLQEVAPNVYQLYKEFQPPDLRQAIESGALPEQARGMYDTTEYEALRKQYEAMGFSRQDARRLAEDPSLVAGGEGLPLKPVDYATWLQESEARIARAEAELEKRRAVPQRYAQTKQKFLAQGMTEEQATARANKAFNVGPEGIQTGDIARAEAELEAMRRALESDKAQMSWAAESAAQVRPTVDRLSQLPREIAASNYDLGHGEEEGFWLGRDFEHSGQRLRQNYDVRMTKRLEDLVALVKKYYPEADLDVTTGMIRAVPGGEHGAITGYTQPTRRVDLRRLQEQSAVRAQILKNGIPLMSLVPLLLAWEQDAPE